MILVDTSVWIDHLRQAKPALVDALEVGRVAIHPFVVGEVACVNLKNRDEALACSAPCRRYPSPPMTRPSHSSSGTR